MKGSEKRYPLPEWELTIFGVRQSCPELVQLIPPVKPTGMYFGSHIPNGIPYLSDLK